MDRQNRVESDRSDYPNKLPQNTNTSTGESPELLRWRADILMDEMMLGAVDLSAGGPSSVGDFSASTNKTREPYDYNNDFDSSVGEPSHSNGSPWPSPNAPGYINGHPANGSGESNSRGYYENETASQYPQNLPDPANHSFSHTQPPHSNVEPPASGQPPYTNGRYINGAASQPNTNDGGLLQRPSAVTNQGRENGGEVENFVPDGTIPEPSDHQNQPYPSGDPRWNTPEYGSERNPYPATRWDQPSYPSAASYPTARERDQEKWSVVSGNSNDYLSSVPRTTDTPHSVPNQPSSPPHRGTNYARPHYTDGYHAHPTGTEYVAPNQGMPHSAPQTGANPAGHYSWDPNRGYTNQYPVHSGPTPALGPVVNSQPFADAMAVGPQASRQSNLLPRQSTFDVQALQQEMLALQEKLDDALPICKDLTEQGLELLEKGRNLLHSTPDRSAEVSYYMNKVRSLVERSGQRAYWSNIYRQRLLFYLSAWLLFSLVVLVSCLLYGSQIGAYIANVLNLAETSPVMPNLIPFLRTLFAGILGSALGALVNMWRHTQKEYGFFDRNYGVLGVMLPIIGAFVSMILYLALGSGFYLFEVNPTTSGFASSIPVLFAFAFGISQEKIYGTQD